MTHFLQLYASSNVRGSISKRLAKEFLQFWLSHQPDTQVVERDLGVNPVPAVDEAWISAALGPPHELSGSEEESLILSDELITELLAADHYVFAIPMYNFTVPSLFKAYVDQVVRVGRTVVRRADGSLAGQLAGRKALVISARGGEYKKGGRGAEWDFHEPYLRKLFKFLGIPELEFVTANPNPYVDDELTQKRKLERAREELRAISVRWAEDLARKVG